MRILITGGLGFIGSHLIERLSGHEMVIIDNKTTNVIDDADCEVIVASIEDTDLSKLGKFDRIYHLASFVGPAGILAYGGMIGPIMVENTNNLISLAVSNHALLVDISSSEIYGHTQVLYEDSPKICQGRYEVRTEYSVGKLLSEIMISNSARAGEFQYQIIRPFNIAGPRQKPDGGFVLPRFVVAALTNQAITVFGNGTQKRAFTDVRDICDAIMMISESNFFNTAWNIGNPANEMSINDLAQLVVDQVGKGEIIHVDPKTIYGDLFAEVPDKIPVIDKVMSEIGWKPIRSLAFTLSDIIRFYRMKIKDGYTFDMGVK